METWRLEGSQGVGKRDCICSIAAMQLVQPTWEIAACCGTRCWHAKSATTSRTQPVRTVLCLAARRITSFVVTASCAGRLRARSFIWGSLVRGRCARSAHRISCPAGCAYVQVNCDSLGLFLGHGRSLAAGRRPCQCARVQFAGGARAELNVLIHLA